MTPVLAAIHTRRSCNPYSMTGPDVAHDDLVLLAAAVAAAPDHGRLGPLDLVHIKDRHALADAFAAAAIEADPASTPDQITAARDRALAGPCLIALIARLQPDHPTIPENEQWISVGAGLQNLLLAFESLGWHAKVVSGRRVQSAALRTAFGLNAARVLVGFVVAGHSDAPSKPVERRGWEELLSVWPR